ncbi:MAG TPA: GNAT family N-acetyltransferase [Baekduia sp.]|nr:GNAT family N-acetyltransferase [Baekduia sp.]
MSNADPPGSVALRVEAVDPTADERWNGYVERHADGLVYHHSGWLCALRAEYGQAPIGLTLVDAEGRLRGVLPLMATRGLPLPGGGAIAGRRLSSLPRTPVAGPLADDAEGLAALVAAAATRLGAGSQLQLKLLEPRLADLVPGVVGHPWRLTYVLELPERPEDVRFGNARNHAAIKRAVSKAHRHGVRVRQAQSRAELDAWYLLYLETMRQHLVPARPRRLFRALWDELRPRRAMRLLLAERDGELLAGCVMLQLGSTVFYGFNGVRRSALDLRPNDAIHWEAIHAACAEGFARYDLGEVVAGDDGLARFKAKWGTEARRLHRYYLPAPDRPPDTGGLPDGRVARAAARTWRRVPLRATALAGDLTYRFL